MLVSFVPNGILKSLAVRVLQCLQSCFNDDKFSPFFYPVDWTVFPEYSAAVPVPIDLYCIKRRLLLQYYRQVESLKFDIQLLYSHCAICSQDEAAIVFVASELMNLLLSTVADVEVEFSTEISAKTTGRSYR